MFSGSNNLIFTTSPSSLVKAVRRWQTRSLTALALIIITAVLSATAPAQNNGQAPVSTIRVASQSPILAAGIFDFFSFLGFGSKSNDQSEPRKARPINPSIETKADNSEVLNTGENTSFSPNAVPCGAAGVTRLVPSQFPTIQAAINASSNIKQDTIQIASNTYTEQIVINKCITLTGMGGNPAAVTIKSPATLALSGVPGLNNTASVVEVRSNATATINNLTIQGNVPIDSCASPATYGVFTVENAFLTMSDVTVDNIRSSDPALYGCQNGTAIRAGSVTYNQIGTLDLTRVTVSNYQKTGIIVSNTGSSATIKDSLVKGFTNPTDTIPQQIAQNGIQVNSNATATITNNRIESNFCDVSACGFNTYYSYGLIVFDSGSFTASGNTFTQNDGGIYSDTTPPPPDTPATATINGNTFNQTRYAGIDVWEGNADISGNFINGGVFSGTTSGPKVGISVTAYDGTAADSPATGNTSATLTSNSISGATLSGILVDDYNSTDSFTPSATAHFNRLASNGSGGNNLDGTDVAVAIVAGITNNTPTNVSADNNFWGCNAGPNGGTGCDGISGSGAVSVTPFLKLTQTATTNTTRNTGETATISTNLRFNSANQDTFQFPGNPHLPNPILATAYSGNTPGGIPVNFSVPQYGSVNPATTPLVNGLAQTTFMAGGPFVGDQIANVTAAVDNAQQTVNITVHDTIAPTVTITKNGPDPTNVSPVSFTVVFSESVGSSFVTGDVTVGGTAGATTGTVSEIAPMDGTTFRVDVTGMTGNGTVTAFVPANAASDLAGNPNTTASTTASVSYFLNAIELVVDDNEINCLNNASPVYTTIQAANAASGAGYIIRVCPGTYTTNASPNPAINITQPGLSIVAAIPATKPVINVPYSGSGTGHGFEINASGVKFDGLNIVKSDTVNNHNLVYVNAANFTAQNNDFSASVNWQPTDLVSRGIEVTSGFTGLLITGNTFTNLRQPAYINGDGSATLIGTISNNTATGSKGFNIAGASLNITGNTFGQTCTACGADIALYSNVNQTFYADLLTLSTNNENALISAQFFSPRVEGRAVSYVDKLAAAGGDGRIAHPYQTIASGINTNVMPAPPQVGGTLPGGTVHVAAGTYAENVNISRRLTVLGPNETIDPNNPATLRMGEAVIVPATSDPLNGSAAFNPNGPKVVTLTADGVTFKGFTVDGNNPLLNSGVIYNGQDVDAGFGIYGTETANPDVIINNNIIKNIGEFAVFITSNGQGGAKDNVSVISNNKVDNALGVFGQGIRIADDAWVSVLNNTVSRVRSGIVIENFDGNATPHPASVIGGNTVSSFRIGIRHNLHYVYDTPGFTISQNTIAPYVQTVRPSQVTAIETTPTQYQGIRVESIQNVTNNVPVTVSQNTLTGNRAAMMTGGYTRDEGLMLTNGSNTSTAIVFTDNNVSDFIRGVFNESPAAATLSCNNIYNNTTGFYLSSAATNGLTATNNNILGNGFGFQNDGAVANAAGNYWGAVDGPGPVGPGSGDRVSTNVNGINSFSPTPVTGCTPVVAPPVFPTVTINRAATQAASTSTSPVNFTVVFSEPVTGFDGSDVVLSGTANPTTAIVTGSGTTYNVAVSGMTNSGTVIATVKVGAAQAVAAGNYSSQASTSTDNTVTFNVINTGVFVTPNAPQGWYYYNDVSDTNISGYDFVNGPLTPPNGSVGSARIQTNDTGKKGLANNAYGGYRLDQITTLAYDEYANNPGNVAKAPALQFDVDYDLNDNAPIAYQGRLVYEPYQNGTVTQGTWQHRDATGGKFWSSKPRKIADVDQCPQSNPCTRTELLALFPNVGVQVGGRLLFRGEGSAPGLPGVGFDGNVDAFTIGINSSNTTFDFEPAPVPTVSYMGADPTNAATLNFKVVFTEPVTGFDSASDVTLGGTANPTTAVISQITPNNGTTYNVAVTGMNGMGTVTVSVPASAAQSSNSGAATAASNTITVNFDNAGPTVTVEQAATQTNPTSSSPINFTVVFSEPVTGFGNVASDVTIGGTAFGAFNLKNAVVTQVSPNDGTTYNVAVSGMNATGTVTISIPAAAAQDNVNNDNTASVSGTLDDTVTFNLPPDTPITVNPTNTNTAGITMWGGYNDVTNSFVSPSYVTGPATPPLGTGSASLNTTANGQYLFASTAFNNTPLNQITELSYSSYAVDPSSQDNLPTLQIGVDYDSTDANTGFQGRLVFIPSSNTTAPNQAPAATPTWQRWNATNGRFWATQAPGNATCTQNNPCPLATILATYPRINIPNTAFGFIGFRSTGGGANAVENSVDKFTIGVNSANTTFNFEAQPPTISINNVTANEGDSGNTAFTFTITQSAQTTLATTVNVSTMDGTATVADNDYTALTNFPVTIAAGATSATVTVNVKGDVIFEPTESFTVKLSNAVNAGIAVGTGTGTITNDDNCVYTLNPTSASPTYTGGSSSFGVTVLTGCTYTATSNVPWITVTGGTPGNGNGTISYTVDSNAASQSYNGAARTGMITVGTATFIVNQGAAPMNVVIAGGLTGLNNTTLTVPVDVTTLTTGRNISSFDFVVAYDPAVLTPAATPYDTTGTILPAGSIVITNVPTSGKLSVSVTLPGATPLSGFGTLLNLKFTVNGTAPSCSTLNFTTDATHPVPFIFNGGNPAATTSNGGACVVSGAVSGRVFYGNDGTTSNVGVPNTALNGVAATAGQPPVSGSSTAPNGNYSLSGFGSGGYTVTPSKTAVPSSSTVILSFDASQIQRYKVGLITLTAKQLEAADVDGNGQVQSFDAALIQQYKVNIPPAFGVNNTGIWKFTPVNRTYSDTDLDINQTGQDYEAILIGDVDGSYVGPPAPTFAPVGGTDIKSADKPTEILKQNSSDAAAVVVQVSVPTTGYGPNTQFNIPITVDSLTGLNVTSYDFQFMYDPTVIQPISTTGSADNSGTLSSGLGVTSNVTGTGILTVSASGVNPLSGSGTLLNLKFKTLNTVGAFSPISFPQFIFNNGISPTNTTNTGRITILGPTAAGSSISGQLLTARGQGVSGATVTLTNTRGEARTVRAGSFGNFAFSDVATGETYTITVNSKGYRFAPQAVSVTGDLTSLNLIAAP